jgi:hypothetical protein
MDVGIFDDAVAILKHVLFHVRRCHFRQKLGGHLEPLDIGPNLVICDGRQQLMVMAEAADNLAYNSVRAGRRRILS